MEKIMNINKIYIFATSAIIILLIGIPTMYKVVKQHQINLYAVLENKVNDAAKKCYYEKKCLNDKITLKELYDLDYLKEVSNPISKEVYSENSYVMKNGNEFKFFPEE